jgi:hypothetical protein
VLAHCTHPISPLPRCIHTHSLFICSTCPVTAFESELARNTYPGPISAGWPARLWSGTAPTPSSSMSSPGRDATWMDVTIVPGASPFTRMPLGASCTASERVKVTIAPFVEE